MRPYKRTFSPAGADRDGIAQSQTPAAGGVQSLTLNGAVQSAGIDLPRHITVYSGSDVSSRVFTITGTDRYGYTVSETITGVNNSTVSGALNFATITSVTVDDDTGAAVEVGTGDSFETAWIPLDYRQIPFNATLKVFLSDSPNLTYTAQYTLDDLQAEGFRENDATPQDISDIDGSTDTHDETSLYAPVAAVRLKVESFVAGDITWQVLQTAGSAR